MVKTGLLFCLGSMLLVLGVVGLVVPLLPGVLLLAAAALCFSALSPRLQARLSRHTSWRVFERRWHASRGLPALRRVQLAFWLTAEAALNAVRAR